MKKPLALIIGLLLIILVVLGTAEHQVSAITAAGAVLGLGLVTMKRMFSMK
ncbi:hypothetical protein [Falsibacillus albus]|uniref:hypothetical protein n=1 Tax=Falsibacillus albus TaxID=2478915 RepID=UPI0013147681|nr:hypothetical protein [Falsibacillus albus]